MGQTLIHSKHLSWPLGCVVLFCALRSDNLGFLIIYQVNILKNTYSEPKQAFRSSIVIANSSDKGFPNLFGPFQPQSRTGLYLADLLHRNPSQIHIAVEHELEVLAENREADVNHDRLGAHGAELLYKKIAELKSKERFDALEEILYTLIVQKFVEARIAMVPNVSILVSTDVVWPLQLEELKSVHTDETLDLILEHSLLVLGKQTATRYFSAGMFAHMSRKSMKEIYRDSITYGYFIRRLRNRFQLEKSMDAYAHMAESSGGKGMMTPELAAAMSILKDLRGLNPTAIGAEPKASEFLAYILSFDADTLKGFRSIRSKESCGIIDRHTHALFKDLDFKVSSDGLMRGEGKDQGVHLNFLRSKELVLEAVTFGSFLWDVEVYVDSYYTIVKN
ncbi:hypothetical protein KP509_15G072600 [Ceratopteris richardii]|uniref:Uncharacterized protein n=1 Tax=Ceratopteris richardii TaxID=49495 RepID=A0A8T2T4Q3_CERRI|nr:hypothetical protein KP509_15G072600 [Ceratopteris richardii]